MTPEHLLAGYISHAFKAYLSSFGLLQKEEKEAHQPEHQKVQSGVIDFSGKQLQVVCFQRGIKDMFVFDCLDDLEQQSLIGLSHFHPQNV